MSTNLGRLDLCITFRRPKTAQASQRKSSHSVRLNPALRSLAGNTENTESGQRLISRSTNLQPVLRNVMWLRNVEQGFPGPRCPRLGSRGDWVLRSPGYRKIDVGTGERTDVARSLSWKYHTSKASAQRHRRLPRRYLHRDPEHSVDKQSPDGDRRILILNRL